MSASGRTHNEEARADTTSFDLVAAIRHQCLKRLGQILRKDPGNRLKQVVTTLTSKEDGTHPEGSLLMNAPEHDNTDHLCTLAADEKG